MISYFLRKRGIFWLKQYFSTNCSVELDDHNEAEKGEILKDVKRTLGNTFHDSDLFLGSNVHNMPLYIIRNFGKQVF